MGIKFVRIDDRLIHGQVVASWSKSLDINRIWVIDNTTNDDEFLKGVMKLVAPANIELVITGEDKIEELANGYDQEKKNTMILAKYPYVMQKLFNTGISFKELDIGGISANPKRKNLYRQISASPEEVETLREIQKSGVNVYFQVTPEDKKTEFNF